MFRLFRRKPDASAAGRALAQTRLASQRERYRARTDAMRADLGMKAWEWAK